MTVLSFWPSSLSLLLPAQGGIYVFQLMDHYTAVVSLVFLAFFEVVAVCWIFGNIMSINSNSVVLFMVLDFKAIMICCGWFIIKLNSKHLSYPQQKESVSVLVVSIV